MQYWTLQERVCLASLLLTSWMNCSTTTLLFTLMLLSCIFSILMFSITSLHFVVTVPKYDIMSLVVCNDFLAIDSLLVFCDYGSVRYTYICSALAGCMQ
ncbi:hypothetical protein EV361DRAFT_905454 [Lentinula raphanica]|uniref:Uncharacterized protein n=1 Tax=Lentinula raphanica TaxID=153919 RepID=A0AA38PGG7_9AGAR|nr:hypothetical protein F5878DRAFT_391412 [Lentinula raphanica]KAJ3972459.1 hypothetical protein EV361DRAFT_905454 [Lentinula raphanica]